MNPQQNKRMILIIVGLVDAVLSGAILLIYFGLLPIDISEWGIPRWVIGVIGCVVSSSNWFGYISINKDRHFRIVENLTGFRLN